MPEKRDYRNELWEITKALSESVADVSDEDVREEAKEAGEDPHAAAERIRARMLSTVKAFKMRSLESAREKHAAHVAEMSRKVYAIPDRPEERRALLWSMIEREPELGEALLTAQHRDFSGLSDEEIETCLEQLQELGALSPLKPESQDE